MAWLRTLDWKVLFHSLELVIFFFSLGNQPRKKKKNPPPSCRQWVWTQNPILLVYNFFFFHGNRLLLGMSPCLGAHWRSSRLAALLSVMVHCSLIHKSVTNSGWLWSSEDQTLSFTVRVRSALISPAQGGSSGRNWTAQKILVHYFLVSCRTFLYNWLPV